MPEQQIVRIKSLDVARTVSAIAVVWLHVAADVVMMQPSQASVDWWIGNVADSLSRWCVPVFVMVSGAVLIPKARNQSPIAFILDRTPRLIGLTVAWTCLYGLICLQNESLGDFLSRIVIGRPFYHLWFLYMMIGLYVVAPFVQRLVDSLDNASLCLFAVGCFGLSGPAEAIAVLYPAPSLFTTHCLLFIGYFSIGPLIVSRPLPGSSLALFATALVLGGAIAFLTGLMLPHLGARAIPIMYGYQNPFVVLMSLAVFSGLLKLKYLDRLAAFAPLTLGVYLVHPLALIVAGRIEINGFLCGAAVGIPLTTLVVVAASAFCVAVIRRIPGLRLLC